jgi:hypothetical protein
MTMYRPGPNFICEFSGFKTKLEDGVFNWDGAFVRKGFEDRRNPQDFVRGVPDRSDLPVARPETPDTFIDPLAPVTPEDL